MITGPTMTATKRISFGGSAAKANARRSVGVTAVRTPAVVIVATTAMRHGDNGLAIRVSTATAITNSDTTAAIFDDAMDAWSDSLLMR